MKQDLFDHRNAFKNNNAVVTLILLTHFSLIFDFYTHLKPQKTKSFLTFLGGIEMEHWAKMG